MQASKPVRGFSADTEILTRSRSWQRFDQITTTDEVATRTPDGEFRWEHPERVTWEPYDGPMVWCHSRTADLLITPDHGVLHHHVRRSIVNGETRKKTPVIQVRPASELVSKRVSLVATSRWEPESPPGQVSLVSRPVRNDGKRNIGKPPLPFNATSSDFAAFMGMYLSEGSLGSAKRPGEYPINISQTPQGKGFGVYQERLDAMLGRHVPWLRASNGVFRFANKALYEYLRSLGGYAWTKVIPPEILQFGRADLETFWYFYWLGDGSMMSSAGRKDIQVMQTTSKAMADSFQEILQKLGGWSKIHRVEKLARSVADGHVIQGRRTLYRVVRRAGTTAFASYIELASYRGHVASAVIPQGAIYVRRNDHPVWACSA